MEGSSKPRILIIDDEASLRNLLRISLESKGYEIDEAANGLDGLEMAFRTGPVVVILDLGLPDIDGFEVLKRFRLRSITPVLVLTVRDSESEKVALLEAGADDYLTKPFSVPELVARVHVAQRRSHGFNAQDSLLRCGRLTIDISQRRVSLDGSALRLTATEFAVLRVLAQANGKVVVQKAILDSVWGSAGTDNAHYLRIYIGMLRKKVETDPSHPTLILTEPGVGYRISTKIV